MIGAGISGLGAAWILDRHCRTTLFEAAPRLGGHARTVEAQGVAVDTGFIVCNRRTYKLFAPLMDHLGVALARSDMSFSASFGGGAYEYGTASFRAIFAQTRRAMDPLHWRLMRDILRFFREAAHYAGAGRSVGDMVADLRLGREFQSRFLLPISGAIWSAPPDAMRDFPAAMMTRFFANHGLLSVNGQPDWLTVRGGSRRYVEAIAAQLRNPPRLAAPVRAVRRDGDGVFVASAEGEERFDAVVFACHAPQARALLLGQDAQERAILGALNTQPNRMTLHSDLSLMPRRRAAWAAWNYVTNAPGPPPGRPISLSYWMNALQNLDTPEPLIVTINPEREPAKLHDEAEFAHPVYDLSVLAALERLDDIQGRGGVYYAGAWTRYGFHEDGLLSALRVAERLGAGWPLGDNPWAAAA